MNLYKLQLLLLLFLVGCGKDDAPTVEPVVPEEPTTVTKYGMTLKWQDEFDYDGAVDSDKWHHQIIPIIGNSWANGEVQHYTNRTDNSYVSDGTLNIVAKKEQYNIE